MPATTPNNLLALDVGGVRIGVAIAHAIARLPRPLTTLDATAPDVLAQLERIIHVEEIGRIVVGLPRNLQGQDTEQTAVVQAFAAGLESLGLPISFQDEALTSRKAEAELNARGKAYNKGDIDSLAATYILEDWLAVNPTPEVTA